MTKRLLAGFLTGLLFLAPLTSSAATTDELIQTLQAQIATLTAKLAELQAAKQAAVSAQSDVGQTLQMIGDLDEGMTGDQVALLQSILSADKGIYPEGKITGYFGPMTKKAVRKFQEKHGIRSTGYVGPITLIKLNLIIRDTGIKRDSEDKNDRDDDRGEGGKKGEEKREFSHKFCIPPGHLTAPGWNKHFKDENSGNLPLCHDRWNPWGEHGTSTPPATTTPDTTAPILSGISVTGLSDTGAHINWTTNEVAKDSVYVSTSTPVSTSSPFWNRTSLFAAGVRDAGLSGLLPNTLYRFIVRSIDAAGNVAYGAEGAFTTLTTPDTTAPLLSSVSAAATGSTTANVAWTTNEAATSKVYYGTTSPLATSTATMVTNSTLVTSHTTSLSGLSASTTYYVIVSSADASANTAQGTEISFTTGI